MDVSLEFASRRERDENRKKSHCFKRLHRGLCVLQKQGWAPSTMRSCLWDIEEEEVQRAVDVMRDLSVCRVEGRKVDGREMIGMRIHDLIHDYCAAQAEKHEGVRQWHGKVAEGCRRRYKMCGKKNGPVGW